MNNENILEELYYGNINPSVKCFDRNSEYGELVKTIADNEKKLSEFLSEKIESEEEQKMFLELMDAQGEILCINNLERFIEGFRLGAKFMLDTFLISQEDILKNI